jgi:hypothetical protein
LHLLSMIYWRCKSLFIATDPYLNRKLCEKIDHYKRGMNRSELRSVSPIRLVESMLRDTRKNHFLDTPEPLPEETSLPSDDAPIVRLAVEARAIFVSTDGRLADRIRQAKMDRKYSLQIMRPKQALDEMEKD